ncbi:ArsR/SmtB family transcription factor [Furfurilactobacillus rossiae]|uniref:ArsR family transcriptional regulator n=1 Tax=Furfurilactobacillus rossiae DSM 15814 TaxID=1114972 RepID=A0A0R1RI95_9LACO|nr:ArsR family transcriptional regulator [Furfurilactobacillus rossiae]KRL54050.1 ArsR family transcriptional regulator [Furfurilactobacillus rossiae DSM 15814]QFR67451.1 helix-turn-helix domain-containing protein [Furfurilactobacillus rossiae]QLE60397.1 Transcriptional regulator ArsR [Furfurilactobacillus rossiae]
MKLDLSNESLLTYKALASPVRLDILRKLSYKHLSVRELAEEMNLSSTIVLMHLNKLAEAGLIEFERVGHNKVSKLKVDHINVNFPQEIYTAFDVQTTDVPVGHFTNFSVKPSCGLAGKENYIGKVDNPAYFMDPERMSAGMIWWTEGFVEYQFPNYLARNDTLQMLDLSMELGSEFPFSNNVWPSDITFSINGHAIGNWTSPGDFSDTRGKYTPLWVPDNVNQYGILKTVRVTDHGSYLDGQPFSEASLDDLKIDGDTVTVRFEVKKNAKNRGGCTIFGKGFGNFNQDIEMKMFYS